MQTIFCCSCMGKMCKTMMLDAELLSIEKHVKRFFLFWSRSKHRSVNPNKQTKHTQSQEKKKTEWISSAHARMCFFLHAIIYCEWNSVLEHKNYIHCLNRSRKIKTQYIQLIECNFQWVRLISREWENGEQSKTEMKLSIKLKEKDIIVSIVIAWRFSILLFL